MKRQLSLQGREVMRQTRGGTVMRGGEVSQAGGSLCATAEDDPCMCLGTQQFNTARGRSSKELPRDKSEIMK